MSQPATLGDAICFVVKTVWPDALEVSKQSCFEQVRMQLGNAVDGVTADDRKVRHSNVRVVPFFNERNAMQ